MRYRTLWEHEGPETVVVCDVHDKSNVQDERLDELIRKTSALGKQMGITFWHAEGHQDDCLNGSALPLKGHCHTDGGLAIWHWGSARETARQIGPYEDYCASALQGVAEVPRGIDEVFDSLPDGDVAKKNAFQSSRTLHTWVHHFPIHPLPIHQMKSKVMEPKRICHRMTSCFTVTSSYSILILKNALKPKRGLYGFATQGYQRQCIIN